MAWTAGGVAEFLNGQCSSVLDPTTEIGNFQIRAWSCNKQSCFVPLVDPPFLPGGNGMVPTAIKKRGARFAIVDSAEGLSDDLPYILVPDLQKAIEKMATTSRDAFDGRLIGVTGTAGKSSVKTMLAHILKNVGLTWATTSNQNLTGYVLANLPSIPPKTEYAVMEIALFDAHTVRVSTEYARPDIGIITSIGLNHASSFKDPEKGIINSKTDLLRGLSPGGIAILPRFSDRFEELNAQAETSENVARIITCGTDAHSDVQLKKVKRIGEQQTATIKVDDKALSFDVPYLGQHMVENATLVAATLVALGLPLELMKNLGSAPRPHSGTMRYKVQLLDKEFEMIDDSFNTGPSSIAAMLKHLTTRGATDKFLVISDIGGLDDDDRAFHIGLAPQIDAAGLDHVFTVGPAMAKMAAHLSTPCTTFQNRFNAANAMMQAVPDGALVAVKGSAAMKFKDFIKHVGDKTEMTQADPAWVIENDG